MAQAGSKNSITAPRTMASWFQGTIGDRRDILEGDDFRNRLVARVETPELADQIVAEHNAAVKAALLPAIPSRRLFLSQAQAAGLAAGGTALALATVKPAPVAALPADDSALLQLEEEIFEQLYRKTVPPAPASAEMTSRTFVMMAHIARDPPIGRCGVCACYRAQSR